MLIIDGVDVTNPVHRPAIKKPDDKGLKEDAPEKPSDVKTVKPVNLVGSGIFHFPQPE